MINAFAAQGCTSQDFLVGQVLVWLRLQEVCMHLSKQCWQARGCGHFYTYRNGIDEESEHLLYAFYCRWASCVHSSKEHLLLLVIEAKLQRPCCLEKGILCYLMVAAVVIDPTGKSTVEDELSGSKGIGVYALLLSLCRDTRSQQVPSQVVLPEVTGFWQRVGGIPVEVIGIGGTR